MHWTQDYRVYITSWAVYSQPVRATVLAGKHFDWEREAKYHFHKCSPYNVKSFAPASWARFSGRPCKVWRNVNGSLWEILNQQGYFHEHEQTFWMPTFRAHSRMIASNFPSTSSLLAAPSSVSKILRLRRYSSSSRESSKSCWVGGFNESGSQYVDLDIMACSMVAENAQQNVLCFNLNVNLASPCIMKTPVAHYVIDLQFITQVRSWCLRMPKGKKKLDASHDQSLMAVAT